VSGRVCACVCVRERDREMQALWGQPDASACV